MGGSVDYPPMSRSTSLGERLRSAWSALRSGTSAQRSTAGYGSLTGGGVVNYQSGMGTVADKSESTFFRPTRLYTSYPLEIVCIQSWAAGKAVRMPVRDMFLRTRNFQDVTPEQSRKIDEALARVGVDDAVQRTMIAARQYGTGLLVMFTRGQDMESPLNVDAVRPGDLTALRVLSRYDCSAYERDYDIASPTYGMPLTYDIHPSWGWKSAPARVHHSRVIRLDGLTDPSDSRLDNYERDWGVSILVPIVQAVLQEAGMAQAAAHLTQEASLPVLSIDGLRDVIAGQAPGEASAEQIGETVNRMKSIYRILMLDKSSEEFTRVAVQFTGLADLLNRAAQRIAAAVDVPYSRFMQDAPRGMNATGDGEFRNYVMTFEAERQRQLPAVYRRLDEVVFRSEGLGEPPEYEWPSMLELTEAETTEMQHKKVLALVEAINAGMIDEDEGRAALDGDEMFGELPGEAPGLPEPELPPLPGAAPPNGPPNGPPSDDE